jgi:hypothetical protein
MKKVFTRIREYLWRVINDPLFVIVIADRKAKAKKGKLTQKFLHECSELCRQYNIKSGYVYGVSTHEGVRLCFSDDIPKHYHQRFRNVWACLKDRD